MSFQRLCKICGFIFIFWLAITGCEAVEEIKSGLFPTPTPLSTPTPQPYIGQVGQRTAYNGWAVTVTNVMRSSIDPLLIVPMADRPNEKYDYISMDVSVERTIDERGSVYDDAFMLLDGDGDEINKDSTLHQWLYRGDTYYGNVYTDRLVFRVPRSVQVFTLQFSPWPAIPDPVTIALSQFKEPRRIDLQEALELGLLSANVRGISLESIEVEVSLKVDESIELSILPGTTFLAPSPDLQTMVVRHQVFIFLEEKDEVSLEVDVACANMRLEAPSGGEEYIVKIEPPAEELRKLMGLPEFQDASFRLQQFAIWTITDNPARGQYVGLTTTSGDGGQPSNSELQKIAGWFESAGIPLDGYPALR
jgi:hypothetical protein